MKILAIAPNRRTGALLYSEKLYRRLPAQVVSGGDSILRLIARLSKNPPDVYHIQFEYRGFGNFARSLFVLTCLSLTLSRRRPVVITLHGLMVPESVSGRRLGQLSFLVFLASIRFAGHFATVLIVHSELMRRVLTQVYFIDKGVVIPHGTDCDELSVKLVKKPDSVVFYGFIRPSKGIDVLIDAVRIVRETHPKTTLTVIGSIARADEAKYLGSLRQRVLQNELEKAVVFREGFTGVDERTRLIGENTVVVLPYTDRFVEVSGVVHDLAEYGVPVICSSTPRFSELSDEFDCLKVNSSPQDVAAAIIRIFEDEELRTRIGANLKLKAMTESWDSVAQRHLSLFSAVSGKFCQD